MFKDIYEYVQETGDTIISIDDPKRYMIGFRAIQPKIPTNISIVREVMEIEYPIWEVRLSTVRMYNGKFREYIRTTDSRCTLAASIPGQIRPSSNGINNGS